MKAKSNIRRLLAGSSLLALLGASNSALAAGGVTITGSTPSYTLNTTTDFIKVTTDGWVLGDLTVDDSGHIVLQAAGTSFAGIEVNSGSVGGNIVNQNLIEVSALSTGLAVGIEVHGGDASIGGGIQNDGYITVAGKNAAAGVLVYGSDLYVGGDIVNGSADGWGIRVTANQAVQSGTAVAGGIIVDVSEGTFAHDIGNDGGIKVNATEQSYVNAANTTAATVIGKANAIASGMGISGDSSFAGVSSGFSVDHFDGTVFNNESGVLNIKAVAETTHIATASGSETGFGYATATAKGSALGQAYGMFATALMIEGGLDNSGTVGVIGKALSVNSATAHGVDGAFANLDEGNSFASASGEANANATAAQADAIFMLGNVTNSGILDAKANAVTTNTARADSTTNADVSALVKGSASAYANGLYVDVGSLVGNIVNTVGAEISALATAVAHNSAVVSGAGEVFSNGSVSVQGTVNATAYGMNVDFGTLAGNIISNGTIAVSAYGTAANVAKVNLAGPASARVGTDYGHNTVVEAYGVYISGGSMDASETGISFGSGGSIDVLASGNATSSAKATGTSLALAAALVENFTHAVGLDVSIDSFGGSFSNAGAVTVEVLANTNGKVTATAMGEGVAQAGALNAANVFGTGLNFEANSFVGGFVNSASGTVDMTVSSLMDTTVVASGADGADSFVAAGNQVRAKGLSFDVDNSAIGNITNNADITVAAVASSDIYTTATASNGGASIQGMDVTYGGNFAVASGVIVSASSLVGTVSNTGDITSSVLARQINSADAQGGDGAQVEFLTGGLAGALGFGVQVADTLIGSASNSGSLTVNAVVSAAGYGSAEADEGDASVSVLGSVYAAAYGFSVGGESISGNIANTGEIAATAIAGNYNGSLLANPSGPSQFIASALEGALAYVTGSSLNVVGLGGALAAGSGTVNSTAQGNANADAVGFASRFDFVAGDVSNSGSIDVQAFAVTTNEARATVAGSGTALANAFGSAARGQAIGFEVSGDSVGGEVSNSSFIGVTALAGSFNNARASGTSSALSNAYANAYGGAFATAIGVGVHATSYLSSFVNSGEVDSRAAAATFNSAIATTAFGGNARAKARDMNATYVQSTGIRLSSGYLGSFQNLNTVNAGASALSVNSAEASSSATGVSGTIAQAYGSAYADVVGVYLSSNSVAGAIANSGSISAVGATFIADRAVAVGDRAEAIASHGTASAHAIGINVDVTSVAGGFINDGAIQAQVVAGGLPFESAFDELSPFALGVGDYANASGQSYAGALAGEGGIIAAATGIYFSANHADNLFMSGDSFRNESDGTVDVYALAASTNIAIAHATGTAHASAGDNGEEFRASAAGILIDANLLAGNVINSGSINVSALGSLVNSASADSTNYALAYAFGSAAADSVGLMIGDHGSTSIEGSVINTGDITILSHAFLANIASAEADYATAYAGRDDSGDSYDVAYAMASGLNITTSSIAGDISNSGAITVSAIATAIGSAHATGVSHGYAGVENYASAYALGLNIFQNNEASIFGGVSNTGAITVSVNASSVINSYAASSDAAYAYAYGRGGSDARATGISIAANIDGDFVNAALGSVNVHATSTGDNSISVVGNGENTAIGIAFASASANGIVFSGGSSDYSIGGGLINHGDVTAVASASLQSSVEAVVAEGGYDYAYAYAMGASADASARGIDADLWSIGDDFLNDGTLSVSANAHNDASVIASADGSAMAYAIGQAYANAYATGIYLNVSGTIGDVINDGAITVNAKADTNSHAMATGGAYGVAYSAASDDDNDARAYGAGMIVHASTLFGDFANQAAITVNATATARADASATGVSSAIGTASGYAVAYGLGVSVEGERLSSFGGYISNSSTIDVNALALMTAVLLAATTGAAGASAAARGTGISISGSTLIAGGLVNDGSITVEAIATAKASGAISEYSEAYANAYALGFAASSPSIAGGFINTSSSVISAHASANATAENYANAYAYALGIGLSANTSIGGSLLNSGIIEAHATADAKGTTSSVAVASVTAMRVYDGGNLNGQVSNSGTIVSTALVQPLVSGSGAAEAIGLNLEIRGTISGDEDSIFNSGHIGASATAPDFANATGVLLTRGLYNGDFVNEGSYTSNEGTLTGISDGRLTADAVSTDGGSATAIALRLRGSEDGGTSVTGALLNSGLIAAVATATSGIAAATAILLEDGASIAGGITNTGIISAEATGDSSTVVAINLDAAGGGTTIRQVAQQDESDNVFGGIYGDIKSNNGHTDLIDWTGGVIEGDLHGDIYDTLSVHAGTPSIQGAFVFSGNINASASDDEGGYVTDGPRFGVVNVNTGISYAPMASLEVSGNMYLGALNVHHNGTLIVDPTAQIDATNVAFDNSEGGTATVQWNIKPSDPQNGTIMADTVTIGSGAKSIAYGEAGLFKSKNDFWVIQSDDLTGVFADATDSVNGTVTPMGSFLSGLYVVSDYYDTTDEEGYHITVNRIAPTTIPGLTIDGQNFATYLDEVLDYLGENDPEGGLAVLLGQVLTGTPEEYAHAVNELSGHQSGDLLIAALGDPSKLMEIIFSQLGSGDFGDTGFADIGSMIRVADNKFSAMPTMNDAGPQYAALGDPVPYVRPASAWMRAFGSWSSLDSDPKVGARGFTSNGGGVIVGGDYRFSETFKAGIAAGYQKSEINFRGNGGDANIESYSLNAYGRFDQGPLYINGMLGISMQSYDMTRRYTPILPSPSFVAHRDPDGTAVAVAGEVGYGFDVGDKSKLTPFLGFLYAHTKIDGSTETGAGPGNLIVDDQSADTASSRLGIRWSKTFGSTGAMQWAPVLELGWKHEFSDQNPTSTASLAAIPGGGFTVNGAEAPKDLAILGVGLNVQLSDAIDGTVRYNGDFGDTFTNSTASIRLRMKF